MDEAGEPTWTARRRRGVLEVMYGTEGDRPQYAALHLHSSYFRLTPGPHAAWGTSVVLAPVLWQRGAVGPSQGAKVRDLVVDAGGTEFHLAFQATVAKVLAQVRVKLAPPQNGEIRAVVMVETAGEVPLEIDRPWDMCKLVMLSSMHISPDRWDAQAAWVGSQPVPLPAADWLLPEPLPAQCFGLRGGHARWQQQRRVGPAPSVEITLDRTLPVTGWLTPNKTVRDDNLALWAAGEELPHSWTYQIAATFEGEAGGRGKAT